MTGGPEGRGAPDLDGIRRRIERTLVLVALPACLLGIAAGPLWARLARAAHRATDFGFLLGLPLPTVLWIEWGRRGAISAPFLLLLAIVLAAVGTARGKALGFERLILRPTWGALGALAAARFFRGLRIRLESGTDAGRALEEAGRDTGVRWVCEQAVTAAQIHGRGAGLADAFSCVHILPNGAVTLLRACEPRRETVLALALLEKLYAAAAERRSRAGSAAIPDAAAVGLYLFLGWAMVAFTLPLIGMMNDMGSEGASRPPVSDFARFFWGGEAEPVFLLKLPFLSGILLWGRIISGAWARFASRRAAALSALAFALREGLPLGEALLAIGEVSGRGFRAWASPALERWRSPGADGMAAPWSAEQIASSAGALPAVARFASRLGALFSCSMFLLLACWSSAWISAFAGAGLPAARRLHGSLWAATLGGMLALSAFGIFRSVRAFRRSPPA